MTLSADAILLIGAGLDGAIAKAEAAMKDNAGLSQEEKLPAAARAYFGEREGAYIKALAEIRAYRGSIMAEYWAALKGA